MSHAISLSLNAVLLNRLLDVVDYHELKLLKNSLDVERQDFTLCACECAGFWEHSDDELLAKYGRRLHRLYSGEADQSKIMTAWNGDLSGLELANKSGTMFCLFLKDASSPGKVRYSAFDVRGFYSHMTFNSYGEALMEAWESGFIIEVSGMLENLFQRPDFQQGMALPQRQFQPR
tara:strand:+ start:85 stop:612 length:528 start_codon:yes stop_codon:yes gene_type:complete